MSTTDLNLYVTNCQKSNPFDVNEKYRWTGELSTGASFILATAVVAVRVEQPCRRLARSEPSHVVERARKDACALDRNIRYEPFVAKLRQRNGVDLRLTVTPIELLHCAAGNVIEVRFFVELLDNVPASIAPV